MKYSHCLSLSLSLPRVSNVRFAKKTKGAISLPFMSPQLGRTALTIAAANGKTATATLLIEKGADIEAKRIVRDEATSTICLDFFFLVSFSL